MTDFQYSFTHTLSSTFAIQLLLKNPSRLKRVANYLENISTQKHIRGNVAKRLECCVIFNDRSPHCKFYAERVSENKTLKIRQDRQYRRIQLRQKFGLLFWTTLYIYYTDVVQRHILDLALND